VYTRWAGGSARLTGFERSAVLAGIQAELLERDATRRSVFRFASERERLQAVIEQKERDISGAMRGRPS
jgi:hypothetical protein